MTAKFIALVAAGLALAACDTLSTRIVGGPTVLYKTNDLDYAAGGKELRVVVLDDGAMLGGHATLQQATVAGLQRSVGTKTRLSVAPQNFNRDFKVVVLYNPAPGVTGGSLCRESDDAKRFAGGDASETHVLAVFCRTTDVLTEIDGYSSGIKTAGDGRFTALMNAAGLALFPSRDLNVGGMSTR